MRGKVKAKNVASTKNARTFLMLPQEVRFEPSRHPVVFIEAKPTLSRRTREVKQRQNRRSLRALFAAL
jgi:hypothetical protein